jgi:Spy/CpxP family protein refolding chaperone
VKENPMKMTQLASVVAGAVLALAASRTPVLADQNPAQGDRIQHRVERMKERLGLTDDQAKQVEQIFRDASQQGKADQEAMRERHKKVHDQIQSILTPEQRDKLEQMKKEHGGYRHHQTNPDSTPNPTNPTQN